MMKTTMLAIVVAMALTSTAGVFAAEQTLDGTLADSLCGASHGMMAAMVAPPLNDRDCTIECVKAGGTYVFVDSKKNVYRISNQSFAGLETHAGHAIKLTGDVKSDSVTVTKIEMLPAK